VTLAFDFPELGPNTAFASGLSSLDAYSFPPRRFVQLYWALRGEKYEPSSVLLRSPSAASWAPALYQLFNVAWLVEAARDQKLTVRPLAVTAGSAWFSAGIRRVATIEALAKELLAEGPGLGARAHEILWLVEDDSRVPRSVPAGFDPACASARVERLDAVRARPWVEVAFDSPGDCPLTLAMNYAETLQASVAVDSRTSSAIVFPAYGTLAAVIVPRGSGTVRIAERGQAVAVTR
jgi:hypothetical protein